MKKTAIQLALVIGLLLPTLACSPTVKKPQLYGPGPASYQRYQATQGHDPYPLPDAGPMIEGGRPRGFQQPTPEVERARQYSHQYSSPQYSVPVQQPVYPGYPVQ